MCILCVIQKWSRKVATMLPWLVIPLIGLWLLSQFLPPAFRFEITSPRLACVLVLLATLFWYEILMPQLSSWRARRNARLKEKKRLEAIEMQKLRKTATRRCRNCRTPYRDQNPSGGKFMCSYCGHLSKRPLFDSTVSPGLERFPNSGVLKDLIGKVWSDNNWTCGQDWIENGGSWVSGSLSGKPSYRKKHSGGFFNSGNDHLFSFLLVFVCKSFAAVFLGIMWLFRKIFRISFSEDDTSSDTDINGLDKKGENGVNCNETKSEKARRKAEEKRQARLEREQLEEEERKQREEVARLVEERRKLRDETDKNNKKDKTSLRDKNDKKGERKREDRKKEKDRGSSKSNSDVDELEKRASKEIERKLKVATDYRENHKSKAVIANDHNKGSIGARYLERMRGNFFPSSRTITGVGFFGKGINANASNTREHRSSAYLDHSSKKDFVQPERAYGKSNAQAVEQNQNRPVIFESQPCPPPKRSWQQLFTRSSPTVSSKATNVISRPNANPQTESQSSIPSGYPVTQGFDNPISYGLPYSLSKFSHGNSNPTELLSKEPNNYEDPCYVPNPASLIGPISESLDNFQLDLGFVPDVGFEKPSPIESPISRYEKNPDSFVFPSTRRTEEKTSLPLENHDEKGWQMWNSSPICPDTLGLVGASRTWYLPPELNGLKNEEKAHFQPQNTMATIDDPWALRTSYGSVNNELVYGIPNGSAINHPFHMHHDNVWAKKENDAAAAAAVVEGIGYTPPQMYSHFGHVNEKEKKETH